MPSVYPGWGAPAPPPRPRRAGRIALIIILPIVAFVVVIVALTVIGHQVATPSAVTYTDPQKFWSATFVGTPTYQSQSVASAAGNVTVNIAEYSGPDHDEFVGVVLAPPGSTFNLQAALNGMASRVGGTVLSSSPTTFQGAPALEGVITTTDSGIGKCMIVHSFSVDYLICAVGASNPPVDYAPLLASVHLTPH